jgi:predicted SprT family Zn-dependent metalloprotease
MKDDGETEYASGRFKIRINRRTSLTQRIDSILHEWAHVLTWFGAGHYEEHPDEWGLCYAKIYRAFMDWDFGRKKSEERSNSDN